jgi:23S rRNA pseudouridine2605 synthase
VRGPPATGPAPPRARAPGTGAAHGSATPRRLGVARVLSKRGVCSRTHAAALVAGGRVRVNGRVVLDPESPVREGVDEVTVDGRPLHGAERIVLMLNKPRGLVTTARDEHDRDTVYRCLEGADLPWLAPIGRLDRASEGLLLFTNDPGWAARVTAPDTGPDKTYHVQIDRLADAALLEALERGVVCEGERLRVKSARLLRAGGRNSWLEVVLAEGRNRQIRRLLAAHGIEVLRLVRVAIGALGLGALAKGAWRRLDAREIATLVPDDAAPGTPP